MFLGLRLHLELADSVALPTVWLTCIFNLLHLMSNLICQFGVALKINLLSILNYLRLVSFPRKFNLTLNMLIYKNGQLRRVLVFITSPEN